MHVNGEREVKVIGYALIIAGLVCLAGLLLSGRCGQYEHTGSTSGVRAATDGTMADIKQQQQAVTSQIDAARRRINDAGQAVERADEAIGNSEAAVKRQQNSIKRCQQLAKECRELAAANAAIISSIGAPAGSGTDGAEQAK